MIGKDVECDEEKLAPKAENEMETKLIRRRFKRMLRKSRVVAESLYDPRRADV